MSDPSTTFFLLLIVYNQMWPEDKVVVNPLLALGAVALVAVLDGWLG